MNHNTPVKVIADSDRGEHADGKLNRRIACQAQILGDPMLGIVVIAGNQIEMIVPPSC